MILEDFVLIASDTARTKAYLQAMLKKNYLPSLCLVYTDDYDEMVAAADCYSGTIKKEKYFDRDIPLLAMIQRNNLQYEVVHDKDINSDKMKEAITKLQQKYMIYSGYGGYILKSHLFKLGKKWLHVHAGILPEYRGSTTAYYSILDRGVIGATAFFLNEGIDEGDMICQHEYGMPQDDIDIDYIYEPFIRAEELIKALDIYINNGEFELLTQTGKISETYFIIHPVLKHLAIKRVLKEVKI